MRSICCNVLSHEMIHMFDFCRADVDFTNLEHLACTEVQLTNFFVPYAPVKSPCKYMLFVEKSVPGVYV